MLEIHEKLSVDIWDDYIHVVPYYVNCFERMLYVVYQEDLPYFVHSVDEVFKALDKGYDEWQKDENADFCCEEFMINYACNKIEDLRKHILIVMYDIDNED